MVSPAEGGVVLDQQDGHGNQHKSGPSEKSLKRSGRIPIGEDDQDHCQIAQVLDPSLERYDWEIGPNDAYGTIGNKQNNWPICSQDGGYPSFSAEKHNQANGQKSRKHNAVKWAAFEVVVRLRRWRDSTRLPRSARSCETQGSRRRAARWLLSTATG